MLKLLKNAARAYNNGCIISDKNSIFSSFYTLYVTTLQHAIFTRFNYAKCNHQINQMNSSNNKLFILRINIMAFIDG